MQFSSFKIWRRNVVEVCDENILELPFDFDEKKAWLLFSETCAMFTVQLFFIISVDCAVL